GRRGGQHADRRSRRPVLQVRDDLDLGRDADDHGLDAGTPQRLDVSEEPPAGHLLAELRERHAELREEILDHVAPRQQGHPADGPGRCHRGALIHSATVSVPWLESSRNDASHTTGATAAHTSSRTGPGSRENARSGDTAVQGVMKEAEVACGWPSMSSSWDSAYPRRTWPHSRMTASSPGQMVRMAG